MSRAQAKIKQKVVPAKKRPAPQFPPEIARQQMLTVPDAAAFKSLSEDTFCRHFGHLIRQISPRRRGVMLGDLLTD